MPSRSDAVRTLYRVGWRTAARLPEPLAAALARTGGRLAPRVEGEHLRRLRHNLTLAAGRWCDDALLRAAVASYLRTFWEVLALPGWGVAEAVRRVRVDELPLVRREFAERGAVVALPHSANWDLAGAWACGSGMPVTTVAERLPDAEFADFLAFRRGLGMEVLSHRDPAALATLTDAARRRRLVCLIADRDLGGRGLPVDWRGQRVTMPAGPALVARRSGAALIPAVCQYEGAGMVIRIGPPVPHRPGRDGLAAMTQDVARYFAATIAEQPEDWHMLQPFFRDAS